MYIADYIKEKLSLEEYSFSTEELQAITHKEKEALTTDLSYLTRKGDIMPLRRGFYLIIPPRYSKQGKLPLQLYIENLFNLLQSFMALVISRFNVIILSLQNLHYLIYIKEI